MSDDYRPLFISPHLDDAILSCGEIIADCVRYGSEVTLLTVFAGPPPVDVFLSDHDKECGFSSSVEAVDARRTEDAQAAAVLGVSNVIFGTVPEQAYRDGPTDPGYIAEAMREAIREAGAVFMPLGTIHPDHIAVADIAFPMTYSYDKPPIMYEEIPYRVEHPEATFARVAHFAEDHRADCDVPAHGDVTLKKEAVACYASQLPELDLDNLFVRERIWRFRMPGK